MSGRHMHELIGVGPLCWAKGERVPEIIKGLRKEWPRLERFSTKRIAIYQCPKSSQVSLVDGSIKFNGKRCPDCRRIY